MVYCHINKNLSKQHLFTITEEFLKYLKKNNISTLNLNEKIKKKFTTPELYFLCSKNKSLINKMKKKIN